MKAWYQKFNNTLNYNYEYGLEYGEDFVMDPNQFEDRGDIEKYLIEIETDDDFPVEIIDTDIKIIKFNYAFNQNIPKLPSHIEEIHFCNGFEENFNFSLFNKSLNNLSHSIKRLYLNYSFDQELLNLPESLEYLEFRGKFNKSLDYLPSSVKEINFITIFAGDTDPITSSFNQPLNNLPVNLEVLRLDCLDFNHPLDNLPKKLKYLKLHFYEFNFSLDNLPENLEHLEILLHKTYNFNFDNLPKKLKTTKIKYY